MTSSLNIPSSPTNCRAFSTNNDDLGVLCKCLTKQLATLDTGTNRNGTARPITSSSVLLDELDVLEAMRIDDERAEASGATPSSNQYMR